jgi:ABC-type multidrug transport system fused ATPase/permease subunit
LAVKLRDSTSVGLTGVSLIQLISFSETLKILIQFWTSLETSIGAVARIKHFSEGTPEENLPGENQAPPPAWPSSGDIQIEGISASYVEGLDVEGLNVKALDAITLSVRAGEKIGVCGRTGSGKSSFLLALLRMLDLSSGSIRVDGIDLSTLPREEVRSRIIAVTQDSFFLPGTVRLNINPYEASVGEAIADVLRKVGLWEVIQEKGGLDKDFEEDMLSHGQKQLFSLARAILRKGIGNVVLLDEATSRCVHYGRLVAQCRKDLTCFSQCRPPN